MILLAAQTNFISGKPEEISSRIFLSLIHTLWNQGSVYTPYCHQKQGPRAGRKDFVVVEATRQSWNRGQDQTSLKVRISFSFNLVYLTGSDSLKVSSVFIVIIRVRE